MNRIIICATLWMASNLQASPLIIDQDDPITIAKHLVYVLDSVEQQALHEAEGLDGYDDLGQAKLKFAASRAEVLAKQVTAKIILAGKRGVISKEELITGYKAISHNIKNFTNAARKIRHPSWVLSFKIEKAKDLIEKLEEKVYDRSRNTTCRSNRC